MSECADLEQGLHVLQACGRWFNRHGLLSSNSKFQATVPDGLAEAWFEVRLHPGVAGVDARRATPPDPRPVRWGLAGCRQLDPSHPVLLTCEDAEVEPCSGRLP